MTARPTPWLPALLLALSASPPLYAEPQRTDPLPVDPLHSVMWDVVHKTVLNGQPVVFDEHVKVTLPQQVEDGQRVPVSVDARTLGQVEEIVLFADYNPLPLALRFEPQRLQPTISVAMRVNQATPIRAAARDAQGVWHVGGQLVDAPGGGCALPTPTRASTDWANLLGTMYGRLWREGDSGRIRLRVMHPMDTGLVGNTPKFHLAQLRLSDEQGQSLARLTLDAPLAENPLFTFQQSGTHDGPIRVEAQDSDGNTFHGRLVALP